MKKQEAGDFASAWGGIASISVALPVIWTAARRRGFRIQDVSRWMCANPARLAGLEKQKGRIAAGYDADFVVFDPDKHFEITKDRLYFRHAVCPYLNEQLDGEVQQVFLGGHCVFGDRQFASERLGREASRSASSACTVSEWSAE